MIASAHGADKSSVHPVKGHNYAVTYERVFGMLQNDPVKLLEIGVGGGESIRMWLEYFPNGRIYGVDLVTCTNPWNTPGKKPAGDRYTYAHGDQSKPDFWQNFIKEHGGGWEIVIDDGGHYNHDVIVTWSQLWPFMAPRGFYCVEDIGCAYTPASIFLTPGWQTHQEFFKDRFDEVHTGDIRQMVVTRELVILEKI